MTYFSSPCLNFGTENMRLGNKTFDKYIFSGVWSNNKKKKKSLSLFVSCRILLHHADRGVKQSLAPYTLLLLAFHWTLRKILYYFIVMPEMSKHNCIFQLYLAYLGVGRVVLRKVIYDCIFTCLDEFVIFRISQRYRRLMPRVQTNQGCKSGSTEPGSKGQSSVSNCHQHQLPTEEEKGGQAYKEKYFSWLLLSTSL